MVLVDSIRLARTAPLELEAFHFPGAASTAIGPVVFMISSKNEQCVPGLHD
jgi:hypothetical protein